MNLVKKTILFFVLILIQNKLSAQVQNNSSLPLVNVNLSAPLNEVQHANSNASQISKTINTQSLSNNDSTIVAPKVFDPLTMDSKPE